MNNVSDILYSYEGGGVKRKNIRSKKITSIDLNESIQDDFLKSLKASKITIADPDIYYDSLSDTEEIYDYGTPQYKSNKTNITKFFASNKLVKSKKLSSKKSEQSEQSSSVSEQSSSEQSLSESEQSLSESEYSNSGHSESGHSDIEHSESEHSDDDKSKDNVKSKKVKFAGPGLSAFLM